MTQVNKIFATLTVPCYSNKDRWIWRKFMTVKQGEVYQAKYNGRRCVIVINAGRYLVQYIYRDYKRRPISFWARLKTFETDFTHKEIK